MSELPTAIRLLPTECAMIRASPDPTFHVCSLSKTMKRRIVILLALLFVLSLAVWSALAHEGEHHSPGGNGQLNDEPLTAVSNMPCVNGFAGTFPCNKVDLAAL